MTILHYIPSLDRASGGTTAYMQLLGKALGCLVDLHIVSHASPNPVEIPHARIHYIDNRLFRAYKKEWLAVLDEIKPDVVHVNCCWLPQMAFAQKWAQAKGYKVVLSPHGMLEPWIMARHYYTRKLPALLLYQKAAVKRADYLHATADSERDNLLKLGWNDKIAVVANGIEVENIEIKTSWTRTRKILFLSRVHVKKGIELLLESAARLKEELLGYKIIIAGEGDAAYINQLKEQAVQRGIAEMFDFTGGVYGKQKWELFREADYFVLPTYSENFGIVVAEALACGTPVITTDGTPWNELNTRHCGWQIEAGNVDALSEALHTALQLSDAEREVMGRKGRKLVEEKYSTATVAGEMKELYEWILNRKEIPKFVNI